MTQAKFLQTKIDKLLEEKGLLEKFIHVSHEMILRGNLYRRIGNPDFIKLGIFPNHYYQNSELIRIWNNQLHNVTKELEECKKSFDDIEELKNRISVFNSEIKRYTRTRKKLLNFKKRLISLELNYDELHLVYMSTKDMDDLIGLTHKPHPIPTHISAIDRTLRFVELIISQLQEEIDDLNSDLFCVGELTNVIEKEGNDVINFQKASSSWSDAINDFYRYSDKDVVGRFMEEHGFDY